MTSTYWRFRITIADRPGGLATVAAAIAGLGVDIVDLDVHRLDVGPGAPAPGEAPREVADDLVLALPFWVDPTMVELTLLKAGARGVSGRRVDPHELVDPHVRAMALAGALLRAGSDDDALRRGLRRLLACDHVWLAPDPGFADPPVVAEARRTGEVALGRAHLLRAGPRSSPGWVLAAPCGGTGGRIAVAQQAAGPFTATQVARARAALEVVRAARATRTTPA